VRKIMARGIDCVIKSRRPGSKKRRPALTGGLKEKTSKATRRLFKIIGFYCGLIHPVVSSLFRSEEKPKGVIVELRAL
jgi:hypothetical protein